MSIEFLNDDGVLVIASDANPLPIAMVSGGGMEPSDISATAPVQWDSSTKTISFDDSDYAKEDDIPTTVAELSDSGDYAKTGDLFSGSYDDLSNKPTIPSKTSDLTNDSGYLTSHQSLADYAKTTDLFSGSYNDLTDKPTIPSKVSDLSDAGDYAKTSSLSTVATSGSYGDLSGTPNLADVATSGSYNDLSNTPAPQDASQVALTSTVSGESDVQAALAALETRIAALEP